MDMQAAKNKGSMKNKATKLDFTGKDIFIGIDTYKKSWHITIMISFLKLLVHPRAQNWRKVFLEAIIIVLMRLE